MIKRVLIESDWNLKLKEKGRIIESCKVLIESDWNLKQYNEPGRRRMSLRINRIRLEFKDLRFYN